jgi:hypothetical protein
MCGLENDDRLDSSQLLSMRLESDKGVPGADDSRYPVASKAS